MNESVRVGRTGEDLATAFLEDRGYRILERNYRFERAEVDIVCFEPNERYELGGELVFVEVKTRTATSFGLPEEAVTPSKQRSIIKASRAYLYETKLERSPCRFDVVSVLMVEGLEPEIRHFRDAFWVL